VRAEVDVLSQATRDQGDVPGDLPLKFGDPAAEWVGRVQELRDVGWKKAGIAVAEVRLADQVSAGA
jgi:hypothetical protein